MLNLSGLVPLHVLTSRFNTFGSSIPLVRESLPIFLVIDLLVLGVCHRFIQRSFGLNWLLGYHGRRLASRGCVLRGLHEAADQLLCCIRSSRCASLN